MDCKKIKNLFSGYLDESLSPEDRELLEKHVSACQECSRELISLKDGWELLSDYQVPVVDDNFTLKVVHRVQQQKLKRQELTLWQRFFSGISCNRALIIPAFASIIILLGAGIIYLRMAPSGIDATGITVSEKIELVRNLKDEDIIRDLEIYENADVLENVELLMDMEAVESLDEEK